MPLAWDNVSAASDSLGYVVATHQTDSGEDGPTALTWYMPLSAMQPAQARHMVLDRSLTDRQAIVADDLLGMHPDLAGAITRIDVWRWGHAMIRPTVGFLTDADRLLTQGLTPPLLRAHSDMSGISIFEEAHYRGGRSGDAASGACIRKRAGVNAARVLGRHLIADIACARGLDDCAHIERALRAAASAARVTVLDVRLHHFGEGHGVTGVVLLAESHMSIHTWPEHGLAAVDIFVCGPHARAEAALTEICEALHGDVVMRHEIDRLRVPADQGG